MRLLPGLRAASAGNEPANVVVETPAGPVTVRVRRSARARRISLAVSGTRREAVLTLPRRARMASGIAFLEGHTVWLGSLVAAMPAPVPFAEGERVPLRGVDHRIVLAPPRPGADVIDLAAADGASLLVPSTPARLRARLTAFLKAEARGDIERAVAYHAENLGLARRVGRIGLRDQKGRWGSCAANGALSFSWRLVLAPPEILSYVAAHEVAHLAEMNHGPRFWRLVEQAVPDHRDHQAWLRRHGAALHRYGAA